MCRREIMMMIGEGKTIKGPFWNEAVRVEKVEEFGNYIRIVGYTLRSKVTFDKEVAFKNPDAEFISFGHPLLEALLKWVVDEFEEDAARGAVFKDPSGRLDGYIWFYIGEVKDGKGNVAGRKILAIYDDGNSLEELNPAILWDISFGENAENKEITAKDKILPFAIDAVEK